MDEKKIVRDSSSIYEELVATDLQKWIGQAKQKRKAK